MSSLQGLCLILRMGKTKTVAGRPVAAIRGCGRAASGWAAPWECRAAQSHQSRTGRHRRPQELSCCAAKAATYGHTHAHA